MSNLIGLSASVYVVFGTAYGLYYMSIIHAIMWPIILISQCVKLVRELDCG